MAFRSSSSRVLVVMAALALLIRSGCSKDPPLEENFSGLKPPVQTAAEALNGLPEARDAEPLLSPLIMAVTASALDGTSFGLAPSRGGLGSPPNPLLPFPRFPSRCPATCPHVSIDDEACEPGKVILPSPQRSPGSGITFERKLTLDWKDGCVDDESQTFVAGRAEARLKIEGIGLLLSDNPDELNLEVETTVDVRYRQDLGAGLRGGLRGTFAGGKSEDGKTFRGSGGLALDLTLEDPALLPPEEAGWMLEFDQRIEIEKVASKPEMVYTTRLRGSARIGTPSLGVATAFIDNVERTWGFLGGSLVGCFDEPIAGSLIMGQPKRLEARFTNDGCDCRANLEGKSEKLTIDTCKGTIGELLGRSVKYLVRLEDFPVVGRGGNRGVTSRR